MKKLIAIILISLGFSSAFADDEQIIDIYKDAKMSNGILLIESLDGKQSYSYNVNRLSERFLPASTFKIPHTLIALEEGLIKGKDEVVKWDGIERPYAPWNKDQTLKSAYSYSCVWYYQRFPKALSLKIYNKYLSLFNYGNRKVGKEIDAFWLKGDLTISVREQVSFLKNIHNKSYGIKASSYELLKEIMLSDNYPGYKLYSKTGWAGKNGWYVGYVESANKGVWFFATRIPIEKSASLPLRKKLVIDSLKAKSLLPN